MKKKNTEMTWIIVGLNVIAMAALIALADYEAVIWLALGPFTSAWIAFALTSLDARLSG